jgi:hypothetical protein
MPINSAFKRSLLNCQPIMDASKKVVSTAFDKTDGYAGVAAGFANLIERQNGLDPRTLDSISLAGVSDFEGSQTFSVDPQRPEIILISKLFEGNKEVNEKLLDLRDFEASIDEADIKTIFDEIVSNEKLREALNKRIDIDYQNRDKARKILESLSRLAASIDNFRDLIDFVGSNTEIHKIAASNKSRISTDFSEDPSGSSMSFKRTFLGLNDLSYVSNTTLLQTLFISLLLPGNIKFSNQNIANLQGEKFLLPALQYDSTSDFLQLLASKDVASREGFFEVESRLPKDAYSKLSLLSDALSYELLTTVGLRKIEKQNVFELLQNSVGPVVDIIRSNSQENTIVSNFRIENNLPFEIRKNTIDGVTYGGVLEKFIDPVISNASLDFRDLNNFSKKISSNIGSYLNSVETLRGIKNNSYSNLKGYNLITQICGHIQESASSIPTNTRVSTLGLQFALLSEIAKNNTSNGIESRFNLFEKVLEDNELIENSVGTDRARPSSNSATNRPRPKSTSDASRLIGSNNFLMNTPAFRTLLNSSSRSNSNSSNGGSFSSLLDRARELANKNSIDSRQQIITPTNRALTSTSKVIKNKNTNQMSSIAMLREDIKNENIPSKVFVRETIRGVLGSLALSTNSNIFSTSKNSQYNEVEEENSDVLNIKESKIEEVGTSYAVLEKFNIILQDVYKRRSSNNNTDYNPVSSISKSTTIKKKEKKSKDRAQDKINRINLLTLGALPIQRRAASKMVAIPAQNISLSAETSRNNSNSFISNVAATKRKIVDQSKSSKSSNKISVLNKTLTASSTLYTNLKTSTVSSTGPISSNVLFGTSLKQDSVKEHLRLISSNIGKKPVISPTNKLDQIDPRTIDKVDTIDELLDMVDSVKLLETSSNSPVAKNNRISSFKKINLDFSASKKKARPLSEGFNPINSINPKFSSFFNVLLDGTNDNTNSLNFNSDINAILNQIKSKNTIMEKIDLFYNDISNTINAYVGSDDVLDSYTSNYKLDKFKIKFIIYQIFMSILSLTQSSRMVRINSTYNFADGFKVQSRISIDAIKVELGALAAISNSSGTTADIVSSGKITTNFSKIIKAIAYCSISNDLILERYSLAKSFLDIYTTSVNSLISSSQSQDIIESLDILAKIQNIELLKNLTQEYISSKQLLYSKVFNESISIKNSTRQIRVAKNVLKNILDDKNNDVDVICVGLPVKTTEILRRFDSKTNKSISLTGKEYIELEFTKRNVQFSDIVFKSSKIRFSPRLEVIPRFSDSINLNGQIEDFIYLCYEENNWVSKNLNQATTFINKITGLSYVESTVLILNHVIDSICKLTFNVTAGLSFDEFLSNKNNNEISKEGYDFFNLLLSDPVMSEILPTGDMSKEDYLEKNKNSYRLKSFSSLGKDVIDKIDQSTYRLLGLFLGDTSFNAEKFIEELVKTNAFERVYCCILNQDDYVFDKISSYSTKSGRTVVDGLLRDKIVTQTDEEIVFNDDSFMKRLDADEISVKINLVSN